MSKQKRSSKTDKATASSKKIENIVAFAKVLVEIVKLLKELMSWLNE